MIKTKTKENVKATTEKKGATPELAYELQLAILATAIDQIKNKSINDVSKDTLKNIDGLEWVDVAYVLK